MVAANAFNTGMLLFVSWTQGGEGEAKGQAVPVIEARLSEAERSLLQRLAARDEDALRSVLAQHQQRIYQLALKITGSAEDAEEVTQDTFLRLMDSLAQFEGRSSLGTWVYKLGLNLSLMRRRALGRRPEQPWADPLEGFDARGHHIDPVGRWRGGVLDAEREQTRRLVREAIADMPAEYNSVLVLADMEGRSRQEIAEMLELSVPAVKSRLHRARLMLRARLAKEFEE